jgi:glycosyltransferase involved in cell wall biosynthesis/MoaA/NifB/PqqE/SkfB family radical SAM enzyme
MKILQVIHGYPPHYMAGSEVYTYNLTNELARQAEVAVFTRIEDPYAPEYTVQDTQASGTLVRRVNKPSRDYTLRDKYEDGKIDDKFRQMMRDFQPDVVHIGHLSHLSTNIPVIAREEFGTPVVFTAHDFWMGCYRGQLMDHTRTICEGPTEERCYACAHHTYKEWVKREEITAYFSHMERVMRHIDLFLAPSRTLQRFLKERGVPAARVVFSPYGFNHQIARQRSRADNVKGDTLRFGFMGRILPVKGVDLLIRAFRQVRGQAELSIFGNAGNHGLYLEKHRDGDTRIAFRGSFDNKDLADVLGGIDVLVVPSIWLENAPLVIQEAHLAGLPVITSNAGGMAELVRDGVDGFLFPLGDESALRDLLQRLVDHPDELEKLSVDPNLVRSIKDDAQACMAAYRRLLTPERITFVTNPGLCNLSCPMCDTHSPFSGHRAQRGKLPIMDFSVIDQTVRELAPLGLKEIIPSTMGEPLLYPLFEKLLDLAAECAVSVNLTTNATFPNGDVDYWTRRLLPVLSDVKFSLNAIDPAVNERIMRGVNTQQQLANIERFLQLRDAFAQKTGRRCTVTLQMTFMRSNVDHACELLRWAIPRGVDRLKGHHLWVTWPELSGESLKVSDALIKRWNEVVFELEHFAKDHRLPNGKRIRLDNITRLREPHQIAENGSCLFLGKEAWIEADGSFQVCCCPSEARKSFGTFGNVSSDSLRRLWSSPRYRSFVASWGDHENCKICNMRKQEEEEIQDA